MFHRYRLMPGVLTLISHAMPNNRAWWVSQVAMTLAILIIVLPLLALIALAALAGAVIFVAIGLVTAVVSGVARRVRGRAAGFGGGAVDDGRRNVRVIVRPGQSPPG